MKKEKQLILKEILESGQYVIDLENGLIYDKKGKPLTPHYLPSGYQQIKLFNGKRNRQKGDDKSIQGIYYAHQVIYFAANGFYDTKLTINHKDRDKINNRLDNLELATMKEQHEHIAKTGSRIQPVEERRLIRFDEVQKIRAMMKEGRSQSSIARELNLNRLSVRATIKKIENDIPLTCESRTQSNQSVLFS